MRVSAFILVSIFFISCQEDFSITEIDTIPIGFPEVDSRLWIYFQSFEREAQFRGYQIDLIDLEITGIIENILENGVAGTCQYGSHLAHVTVDQSYWNQSSSLSREFVVFHELGHCVLNRDHEEASFQNGNCISIMSSGTGNCKHAYTASTREYYLDEMFNRS